MQFKHEKIERSNKNKAEGKDIYLILLPVVLSILMCAVCLTGSTYAWFVASQNVSSQTIQAANYDVAVQVSNGAEVASTPDGIYKLEAGKTYTVVLTASGQASTGYCMVYLGNMEAPVYHTAQILPGDENKLTFEIVVNSAVDLKISDQWGTSSKAPAERLVGGQTITYNG